jgi:hypothetical protein
VHRSPIASSKCSLTDRFSIVPGIIPAGLILVRGAEAKNRATRLCYLGECEPDDVGEGFLTRDGGGRPFDDEEWKAAVDDMRALISRYDATLRFDGAGSALVSGNQVRAHALVFQVSSEQLEALLDKLDRCVGFNWPETRLLPGRRG